jgi:hypothetical protein
MAERGICSIPRVDGVGVGVGVGAGLELATGGFQTVFFVFFNHNFKFR